MKGKETHSAGICDETQNGVEKSSVREQWKRLADAFSGRGAPELRRKSPRVDLAEMAETLAGITDEQWGRYAFSRAPLEGRFDRQQKLEYTKAANACGKEWAARMMETYQTRSPRELARKMGMKILTPDTPAGGGQVIFAQFVQPDEITVYMDCIRKASRLAEESGCVLLEKDRLFNVLLAHELFHAVEEQHADEIYTRTEKVELWRKPFSNRSSIACLSEMAAMAFARELLGLACSPYMLDVLLVYAYDKEAAWGLYEEIGELIC